MNILEEQLENLIDDHNIGDVLTALTQVCFDKSEHLASDWHDHDAAKYWSRLATKLQKIEAQA